LPRQNRLNAQAQLALGLEQHRAGQIGLAQSYYQGAVKLDPTSHSAWHLLGICAYQQGLPAKAIKHYQTALKLHSGSAEIWNNLAISQKSDQQFDAAAQSFAKALELRPEYAEAAHNLALLHEARGEFELALSGYQRVLQTRPDAIDSLSNLGNLLRKLGQFDRSAECLQRADAIACSGTTQLNLALLAMDQAQYAKARAYAEKAFTLEPDSPDIRAALASCARLQLDYSNALLHLRALLAKQANSVDTLLELALTEQACGDFLGARTHLAKARKLAPKSERLRWIDAFLLPLFVDSEQMRDYALAHFEAALSQFEARTDWDRVAPTLLLEALLSVSGFDLTYLAGNTRPLHQRFSRLVERVFEQLLPRLVLPDARTLLPAKTKLRVGVISSYLREHTVMRFFAGLIQSLSQSRQFELVLISTGGVIDATTESLRAEVAHFIDAPWPVLEIIQTLRGCALDLLLFVDIGMDSQQHVIAAAKTAPKQAALYGHPISSGMTAIDYYFSGELLEPEMAQQHYCELLINLPKLGAMLCAPKLSLSDIERAPASEKRQLLCTQNLAKLGPEFDRAIAQLAERLSLQQCKAQLQFFDRQPELSARFIARLMNSIFPAHRQFLEISLLPSCSYAEFMAHIAHADLVLDSPWFSGGATSVDALSLAVPVLTWQAAFARGRQTAAMLQLLDCADLVCSNEAEFADKAMRILLDPIYARAIREQLQKNAHRLFEHSDVAASFVQHIEALLTHAATMP
jgi:protein O-GlcNAc transferase